MTAREEPTPVATWVAIDIAKVSNAVVVETPNGRTRRFRVANSVEDHDRFVAYLHEQPAPCRIAFEPTGMYHRPLGYRLLTEGFDVRLISSLAAARHREAVFTSRDKNDPKDAAILLRLLKQDVTLRYHDPLVVGTFDLQEISQTYLQVIRAKTRIHHSVLTHYLPLYWPEFQRYWHATRADWILAFLGRFPIPAAVRAETEADFARIAGPLVGRKPGKQEWLHELYELAGRTIGMPLALDSLAVRTFQMMLRHYRLLVELRTDLERLAEATLATNADAALLRSIPGIGPLIALTILAEAGDLRRFDHHREFLKFCGLDLAKSQSGQSRGVEHLSKRGNARLRCVLWMAAAIAVRQRENSLRTKYDRYLRPDPLDADRKRKALTATAAKLARIAYAVVKTSTAYRPYFEQSVPRGSIPFSRAVEASGTS